MSTEQTAAKQQLNSRTRELVSQFQQGDQAAFAELYELHFSGLQRYLMRKHFKDDEYAAEDCAQTAFLKAFNGLKDFRGDSEFFTWLTAIAKNQARKEYAENIRDVSFPGSIEIGDLHFDEVDVNSGLSISAPEDPADTVQRQRIMSALQSLIDTGLSEGGPIAEGLRYMWRAANDGVTYQQFSDEAGIPIGTVRSRIFRARNALAEKMLPHLA